MSGWLAALYGQTDAPVAVPVPTTVMPPRYLGEEEGILIATREGRLRVVLLADVRLVGRGVIWTDAERALAEADAVPRQRPPAWKPMPAEAHNQADQPSEPEDPA